MAMLGSTGVAPSSFAHTHSEWIHNHVKQGRQLWHTGMSTADCTPSASTNIAVCCSPFNTTCPPSSIPAPPPATSGWPVSLLEKLGLSDLLAKWPQEVLNLADPVGHLTARYGGQQRPQALPPAITYITAISSLQTMLAAWCTSWACHKRLLPPRRHLAAVLLPTWVCLRVSLWLRGTLPSPYVPFTPMSASDAPQFGCHPVSYSMLMLQCCCPPRPA
jgi:hypothetical protein